MYVGVEAPPMNGDAPHDAGHGAGGGGGGSGHQVGEELQHTGK